MDSEHLKVGLGTHCRHCRSEKETLAHILGACPHGELLRNSCHHKIRSLLASALRGKNYQVEEEVYGLSTNGSTRRIDIIAIPTRSTSGFIIDPTMEGELEEEHPVQHLLGGFSGELFSKHGKGYSLRKKNKFQVSWRFASKLSTASSQRILNLTGSVDNNDITLQRNRNKTAGRIDGCHGDCLQAISMAQSVKMLACRSEVALRHGFDPRLG
ncbi:hypothetical protein ANN_07528 [Periplaneta americana]|uniref:Reverse transcriptase n=1 Tax=Periplaneta americana TaxID=6978 RepID=A0ABQ8SYV5_PERAM|nr:hypothetical protein ANN_07528 [Periplaneta americana]